MAARKLDADACYQAMLARDTRFDGKFFVGVKTTGIYCRPICPARPRRENVEFHATALEAERAGYRPCLRCRPEAAPLSPAWMGKSALVQRALKALSEPEAATQGENAFAARFGVTARHLRRLFVEEVGKSPSTLLRDGRLDFARALIVETALPMAGIAEASGFASVRRFNQAVADRFRRSPTALRRRTPAPAQDPVPGLLLDLPFRPPFDFAASLAYYRSHALEGLETITHDAYERLFRFPGPGGASSPRGAPGAPGIARVTLGSRPSRLSLKIIGGDLSTLGKVVRTVRRLFDLDSDPLIVTQAFAACPRLARLRRAAPGLRSPRGWDPFETAISAILGQLVSIAQANRMIGRLIQAYGERVPHPRTGAATPLFPTPKSLAEASLHEVGTTAARREVLREFSRRLLDGRLRLDSAQDPGAFRDSLRSIRGIGPWTAEYISLRSIADADAFPATDLVLKRALAADPALAPDRVRPWRGYAAAHLWKAP